MCLLLWTPWDSEREVSAVLLAEPVYYSILSNAVQGSLPECRTKLFLYACFYEHGALVLKGRKAECMIMNTLFSETLKKLRKEKGLSQIQPGNKMFVSGSAAARFTNFHHGVGNADLFEFGTAVKGPITGISIPSES